MTFEIWKRGNIYEVIFRDDNGVSILSKTKTLKGARLRAKHHIKILESGHLLREDSSVWKITSKGKLRKIA